MAPEGQKRLIRPPNRSLGVLGGNPGERFELACGPKNFCEGFNANAFFVAGRPDSFTEAVPSCQARRKTMKILTNRADL